MIIGRSEYFFWNFFIVKFFKINQFITIGSHVTYRFHSESTLYSCLNDTEFLAQNKCKIWSLSDCNWTRIHNHLVCKQTLKHLAKLFVYELSGCVFEFSCSQSIYMHKKVKNLLKKLSTSKQKKLEN